MKTRIYAMLSLSLLAICTIGTIRPANGQGFQTITNLSSLAVSATTGEKPQSKVWTYAGRWWMVMPTSSGTYIWRLDGTTWSSVLSISSATTTHADCKAVGGVTHILLFQGTTAASLVSVEYVPASNAYQLWTTRNTPASITLDASVETATIDVDGTGRMWLASDGSTSTYVRWSDSPYSTWSSPITIASGIVDDDISVVIAFDGKIGVMWSNQNTKRFGFRYHVDGADPAVWLADEVPASQSANDLVGTGMADDHMNLAVATDGTIYAAVKTGWDTPGYPKIAMLVRRPAGTWDNLYGISESGTRGIVVLNEAAGKVKVIYTSIEGNNTIVYNESPTSSISFGFQATLISGAHNDASSTKQKYASEVVIIASNGSSLAGVLATDATPNLVAHWKMDETSGTTLVDASAFNNNATTVGSPTFVAGILGNAVQLNGTSQYATAPHSSSLNINGAGASSAITLAAWIKPTNTVATTQNIIKKANTSSITDGYELSLGSATSTWPQKVFFRLNQLTSLDVYRVNSTTVYPLNGTAWMHIAATFDGTTMKLYVNGIQEGGDVAGPAGGIDDNTLAVGIGAQPNAASFFTGLIDDARIYNRALSASEIQALLLTTPPPPSLVSPSNLATGIAISPTLSWNASSGATSYQAQVSTVANFATTVFNQSGIATTSASVTPALSNNTLYYWRVNATNAQGTSDWSSTWSFTTVGSTPPVEDNGAGYALDFDGTDDYVNCGNSASVQITGTAITMEAWIKPTKVGTMAIIKKTGVIGGGTGYELYCGSAGFVYCRFNGLDASRAISTTPYPTDGRWMHVTATYDGISTKMYINGVPEGTTAYTAAIVNSTNPLYIANDPSTALRFLQGSIDEVRLWNVARSDADIKANMTKKLVGNESGLVGYWRFDETSGTLMNDETSNHNDGTMTNMDPATDHVWSGAALGDASAYDYLATGGYTATISHSDGDALTATTTSGTITGIQVYRADDNALRTGSTVPAGYSLDPSRFWGVRAIGTATPTYTLVYNYTGNPAVTTETGLKLVKRNDISVAAWTDAGAVLDINANTLTLTGATGTEYALGLPTPPTAPSGLNCIPITCGQINLSWTDNSSDETNFEIERSTTGSSGTYSLLATIAANTITYSDKNLNPSAEYCYRVRATNTAGYSGWAGPVCATTPVAGQKGLSFNGSTQYVTSGITPSNSPLNTSTFTVETWFRRDGTGVGVTTGGGGITSAIPLVTKGTSEAETAPADINYFLGINTSGNVLCADFEEAQSGASPSLNHPISGTTAIVNGTWYHAAATYDGSKWQLFLNGILEAELVVGRPANTAVVSPFAMGTSIRSNGSTIQGYFNGALDEVRLWNYARTQSEIQLTVNSEISSPQTGLLGRWGLNEGTGTIANNTIQTNPYGTLVNTPVWITPGAPFNLNFNIPADPTNLTAIPLADNKIKLDWTDNSTNETNFEIERSTAGIGGPFTLLTSVAANTVTFTNEGLTAGDNYCYRVRAINGFGPSANYTNISCATAQSTPNNALDFGTGSGYVTFGNNTALALANITLECWFKREGTGTTANTGTGGMYAIPLVTKGRGEADNSNVDMNYFLGIRATDNVIAADFEEGAGGTTPGLNHPVFGTTPIVNDTWYHAAATYDGTTWHIYLNGLLEAELTVGQPLRSDCIQHAGLGTALNSTGVSEGHFDGVIDEARIWNIARSLTEIQTTINSQITTSESGLIARWGLNEGTGTAVASTVVPAVNGTIQNTGWSWVNPGAPFNITINNSPDQPLLVAPEDNATNVSTSPSLSVTVTDPESDDLTVAFYGRAVPSAGEDFTVVGFPDTQNYTASLIGGTPDMFNDQTLWVKNNQTAENIVFASHYGDVTNDNTDAQWQIANTAMSTLDVGASIPFGIAIGNHDQTGSTALYNTYFGESRFTGRSYYGGHSGSDNDNNYELFSAGGMDFIIIHLEMDVATADIQWADARLQDYPDRRAIVTGHSIIGIGNPAAFTTIGSAIYNELKDNPNLFMMLCGHDPGVGQRTDTYNGNTVYTMLADYQSIGSGGNGYMRIMEFSPQNNLIYVKTYSPHLDAWLTDATNQFTLPCNMQGVAYQLIGTNTNVPSGTTTSITWPGLANGTEYEWYVSVSDGDNTVTGSSWSFTTDPCATEPVLVITNPAAVCSPATVDITLPAVTAGSTLNGGTLSYWTDALATNALVNPDAVAVSGTYYIKAETPAGCTDIKPVVVIINSLPVVASAGMQYSSDGGTNWTGMTDIDDLHFAMCVNPAVEWYTLDVTTLSSTPDIASGFLNPFKLVTGSLPATWWNYWTARGLTSREVDPQLWDIVHGVEPIFYIYKTGSDYQLIDGYLCLKYNTITALRVEGTYPPLDYTYNGTVKSIDGCVSSFFDVFMDFHTVPVPDDPANVTVCDSYTLPALTVGNYFTGAGGTGTQLDAGDAITTTQTIYVYAETGTTPNCSAQNSFVVTVNYTPVINNPGTQTACATFTLPDITGTNLTGNEAYYDDSQAKGGQVITGPITVTQTVWIYDATATTPDCSDEESFLVTINPLPVVYNVTGTDAYCAGTSGVEVGLSGSQSGVSYQLYKNAIADGLPVPGTGSALSFGYQLAGTYTVIATNGSTTCINTMNGSAVVTELALPVVTVASMQAATGDLFGPTGSWYPVNGSLPDYTMCLDPSIPFYYLDIDVMSLSPGALQTDNLNPFTLTGSYPELIAWFAAQGVVSGAPGWLGQMYLIITGQAPMFYIYQDPTSFDYQLIDGLAYQMGGGLPLLKVNGNYLQGTYAYAGTVRDANGCTSSLMTINITFNTEPVLVITNPAAVCSPATVDLTLPAVTAGSVLNGGTLSYWTNELATNTLVNPNAVAVSGTYYIKAETPAGCRDIKPVVVIVNPLPLAYDVTGTGAYCAGTSGVEVGLSGSQSGVSYQLYKNAIAEGLPMPGTGSALSFGYQLAGTYTVIATDGSTACVNTMSGSLVVTELALPVVTVASMQAATGDLFGPTGSWYPVNGSLPDYTMCLDPSIPFYYLDIDVMSLSPGALQTDNLNPFTLTGSYPELIAWFAAQGVVSGAPGWLGQMYLIITGQAPMFYIYQDPTSFDYQLIDGLAYQMGGGLPLLKVNGNYLQGTYAYAGTVRDANGCTSSLMTINITFNTEPVLVITNPAAVCSPATVDLTLPAVTAGSVLNGGTLSYWTNELATNTLANPNAVAVSGTYYIKAETPAGCRDIKPVVVIVNPLPLAYDVTGTGAYCAGTSGVEVGLSGSQSGVSYQLYKNAIAEGLPMPGTGSALSFGYQLAGTYTVIATNGSTSCVNNMNGSAVITINPLPAPTITGDFTVCANSAGNVYSTANISGHSYLWNATGGTVTGGQGTSSVTVTWGSGASGTVTVTEYISSTFCSASDTKVVTLYPLPAPVVSGPATVLVNSLETYTTANVFGYGYTWNVTGGMISSNPNPYTIIVQWQSTPGIGTVSVTALNIPTGCVGTSAPYNVTINSAGYTVSGSYTYYNPTATPPYTPLDAMTLTLKQGTTVIGTTTTDANGYYQFNGVNNGTYSIDVSTLKSTDGSVNSNDAGLVNSWHGTPFGQYSVEHVRWNAGDVTNDNYINATDAGTILGYTVSNPPALPRGPWTFWKQGDVSNLNPPATSNTIGVSGGPVTQDFYGLCTGDFNMSFTPPTGAKSATGGSLLQLKYRETIKVFPGSEFDLPVYAGSGMEIGAITLIMNFPEDLVTIEGVSLQDGLTGGQVGSLAYNVIADQIRIAWFNDTPILVGQDEPILVIRMHVSLAFKQGDVIRFTLTPDPINELGDGSFETIENALITMNMIEAGSVGIFEQDMKGLIFSNHPNPFSDYTLLNYSLPFEGKVSIHLINMLGTEVRTVVDGPETSGRHSLKLITTDLPAGVYTARLRYEVKGEVIYRTIKIIHNLW